MFASGKLIINEYGNGFVNIDNKSIYIKKQNLNFGYNNQIVNIKYHIDDSNGNYYGEVVNFSLIGKTFIGIVYNFFKEQIFIYVPELKKSNLIMIKSKITLNRGDWVKIKVVSSTNNENQKPQLNGFLIERIPDNIDLLIEKKYDLNNIFISNLSDIKTCTKKHFIKEQAYLNTFTIDPQTTQDCDDAFSIKPGKLNNEYHIYVHISDLAHYINPDHPDFEDIAKRGTTYYGKNTNWSMIPRFYADSFASILPNKRTNVVTCEFIYNSFKNKLKYVGWYYSIIESKNKYSYEYVDLNFHNNDFSILYESSKLIKAEIDDFILCDAESKSHLMVRYWMIKVNQIMCKEVKSLYRCHLSPENSKLNLINEYIKFINPDYVQDNLVINADNRSELINLNNDKSSNKLLKFLLKSCFSKAYYSSTDEEHYGLGIDKYTHWTSPIRRLCDLINHCILKGYKIDVEKYLEYMDESRDKQMEIEAFIRSYEISKKCHPTEIYNAIIIDIKTTGIIVYIEDLDNKYNIHISKLSDEKLEFTNKNNSVQLENKKVIYKMFQEIKVYVIKVDFDTIDFSVLC